MIRNKDDNGMGRFSVEVELANYEDMVLAKRGSLAPDRIRRLKVKGVVDSGAAKLVLPESVVRRLDLPDVDEVGVRYADGRRETRKVAGNIHLTCLGRSDLFSAIVEPGRDDASIGVIVLEALDLIVDCTKQTLVPRDPHHIIAEID